MSSSSKEFILSFCLDFEFSERLFGEKERSLIVKYLLSPIIPEFSLTFEFKFRTFDLVSLFLSRALNPDLKSV